MKRTVFAIFALGILPGFCQQESADATHASRVEAFAIRPPDENSPFFLDANVARQLSGGNEGVRPPTDQVAEFPKNRGSDNSAWAQVRGFFTGMFSSINFGPLRTPPVTSKMEVEPSAFPLQDRRELSVTYQIFNNSKKIMRLNYPTSQRIDIFTYDAQGAVIDKWSDDRSFTPDEGIVVINPKERIEYQEKIPTREMKAGQNYRVDAFATTDEKFLTQKTISPQ